MLSCRQILINQWLKQLKFYFDPIIGNYDILAFKRFDWKNNTGYVIDLTSTFDGDIQTFH
jgi:hypothetical protein